MSGDGKVPGARGWCAEGSCKLVAHPRVLRPLPVPTPLSSTVPAAQPLAAALEGMSEEERAGWQLPEKALRAFHYRAVQRIYGEQGAQVGRAAAGTAALLRAERLACLLERAVGLADACLHTAPPARLPHLLHACPLAVFDHTGGGAAAAEPRGGCAHRAQPADAKGSRVAAGETCSLQPACTYRGRRKVAQGLACGV